jgi:hypothetical protein
MSRYGTLRTWADDDSNADAAALLRLKEERRRICAYHAGRQSSMWKLNPHYKFASQTSRDASVSVRQSIG